jgi:triacylglycerol lipase
MAIIIFGLEFSLLNLLPLILEIQRALVNWFGRIEFARFSWQHVLRIGILMATIAIASQASGAQEEVILLHGLCRTSRSMRPMERALTQAGYRVLNVDYPSRTAPIQKLADDAIGKALNRCQEDGATKIDFVTHSLGGILVRSYIARHVIPSLGRVVMLAPPNQGSEIVDRLGSFWLFKKFNGPAGNELGTDKNSVPNQLGPANFPLGIIAGDRSINWINSLMIPGPDDGKVSVQRTKLAGMADFLVLPATHPFIMRNREAIRQTIEFLRTGRFDHSPGKPASSISSVANNE